MNKLSLTKILEKTGLRTTEAKVYMASLELGAASVSNIAKEANIKRTTVYPALKSLIEKGLMNSTVTGIKQSYEATSPDKLERFVDDQKKIVTDAIPDFMSLYTKELGSGEMKRYKGVAGMRQAFKYVLSELKPGDEYLFISDSDKWINLDPEFLTHYVDERAKLKLKQRGLVHDTTGVINKLRMQQDPNIQIKRLPDKYDFRSNIMITSELVIIQKLVEPMEVTTIKDKNIADFQRDIFNILWEEVDFGEV